MKRFFLIFALVWGIFGICGRSSVIRAADFATGTVRASLTEEEAELLVRSAAFAARGSMRIAEQEEHDRTRTAASYAARVGIIATVLNRLDDPRFPDSVTLIIASDRTFSEAAPAVEQSESDLSLTRAALDAALHGFDPTNGALYFSTPGDRVNTFTVTSDMDGYLFGVPVG